MAGVRYDHEYDAMYAGLGVVCFTRAHTSIAASLKLTIESIMSWHEVEVSASHQLQPVVVTFSAKHIAHTMRVG